MTNVLVYQLLVFTVEHFRGSYQPVIALIFPVTRELTIWLFTKMIRKCANGDEREALIVMLYGLNVTHTFTLCYIIGSVTDEISTWVLMGFDFLINHCLCLRIVRMRKRNQGSLQHQMILLQELAVAELVEFHAQYMHIIFR